MFNLQQWFESTCLHYLGGMHPACESVKNIKLRHHENDDGGAKPIRSCESDVPCIFSFSTLDALCKACFRLQNQFSHISIESKLYYTQGKYQLIILSNRSPEKQLLQMLQEYGQLCGKSNIAMAWIQEHGKELIAQGAVVEIAKLG